MTRHLQCAVLLAGAVAVGQRPALTAWTVAGQPELTGDAALLHHPRYEASFGRDGWVTWRPTSGISGALAWRYQLQALVRGSSVTTFDAIAPRAIDGGVEYRRHGLVERYFGRDAGIEQVFEITQPTPGDLRLRGRAPLSPGAEAAVVGGGVVVRFPDGRVLTYSKPAAFDRDHAAIPVRVELLAETLDLVIEAADLEGRPFPVTIDPLVSAPQQISTESADDVRVAHDSDTGDFLVVYRQWDGRILGQRFTADGVPHAAAFEVCDYCEEPRVAFNERFLVTWRSTQDNQIQGRFVNQSGPEPYDWVEISQAVESSGRHAEIAATNSGFVVAWIGQDLSTSGVDRVRTRTISTSGDRGSIYSVDVTGTGSALSDVVPSVAYDPFRNRTLVTYVNGGKVYGTIVGSGGTIGFPGQISTPLVGASTVSAAFDHVARRYLVVWTEPFRAALLDDGASKLSEFPIVARSPAPSYLRVDVVAEGGGFTLSFSNVGATDPPYNYPVDLAHRLVTTTGVVTDLGLLTTDGASGEDSTASMAVGEGGYGMLAFAKRRDTPVGGVFVAQTARPAPRIATQPQGAVVTSGSTVQLSVTTVGGPYTFQWHAGSRGPDAVPIAGAAGSTYVTPPLTEYTSFWVRVTNATGISTDSKVATIMVATPPTITQSPTSQTVGQGQSAILSVAANGTAPLTYQWYQGSSGVTSSPVPGATSSVFITPSLTATTSYWVRVSSAHGSADSAAAVITVTAAPTILASPASQSIGVGQTAALTVTATGTAPLTYQWYQGASGATSAPVAGATASTFTTPPLTSTTSYWVRVSNPYGSADSAAAVITVPAGTPPTSVGDAFSTAFQTPLTVPAPGVLTNDLANGGSTLTAELVATTSSGALSFRADGGFTYTPNTGFVGNDSFTYRALGSGGAGSVATVTLTVNSSTTAQPPSALTVESVVGTLVTLRWTPPAAGPVPTGYVLQGGLRSGETLAALPTGSPAPIFTFTAPAGSFVIRMLTVAGGTTSAASNEVPLHVSVPVPPSAPTALTGLAASDTLTLSWKHTFAGGPPTGVALDVTGAITTSLPLPVTDRFRFAGVPAGTYTFRLRATNGGGSSAASPPVTLTFPGTCTPPEPPRNVLAYRIGNTLSLIWDPPATGAAPTGYVLGVVSSVFTGDLPLPGRGFSAAAPAGSYTFTVRSTNTCGGSAPSTPQTVTIL